MRRFPAMGLIIARMVIKMDETRPRTIAQLQEFLEVTPEVSFKGTVGDSDRQRYELISRALKRNGTYFGIPAIAAGRKWLKANRGGRPRVDRMVGYETPNPSLQRPATMDRQARSQLHQLRSRIARRSRSTEAVEFFNVLVVAPPSGADGCGCGRAVRTERRAHHRLPPRPLAGQSRSHRALVQAEESPAVNDTRAIRERARGDRAAGMQGGPLGAGHQAA